MQDFMGFGQQEEVPVAVIEDDVPFSNAPQSDLMDQFSGMNLESKKEPESNN